MAAGRALLQLGAVALVVTAVFDQLGLSALFLMVMLAAAPVSAAGRWENLAQARARALAAIAAGAGTVVAVVFASGAFVGMLLGGASPTEAAQVQLTVLFLLLGAEAIAAIVATHLVANALVAPGERIELGR